ncbi:MAG TPA: hypothetical protein VHB47_24110 [Thermoanaerobaculia bacterium]|jgi:hypothetical protein|nr:hypothetical protein [Thermoanaerobaculia bacterium]
MLADFPIYITFAGLIAFVPMNDNATDYRLLMPQASGDQDAPDGCPLPRHVPVLLVSNAFDCTYDHAPCPDGQVLKQLLHDLHAKSGPDLQFAFRLEGKDVTITFPQHARAMHRPTKKTPRGTIPQDPVEAMDPYWIPTMPKLTKVNQDCLKDLKQCPLAARAEITGASMQTCHLVQRNDHQLCATRFKTFRWSWLPWGRLAQAAADSSMMEYDLPSGTVDITIRDLPGQGSGVHYLVLKPRTDKDYERYNLWLLDLPVHAAAATDGCAPHAEMGKHYVLFYDLAQPGSPGMAKGMPVAMIDRPYAMQSMDCVANPDSHQPPKEGKCSDIPLKYMDDKGKYFDLVAPGNLLHCGMLAFSRP